MTPLVVVDPALGRTGAHNLAFAEMLVDSAPGDPLGVCGNARMAPELVGRLRRRCELVEPVFDLDFYALAGRGGDGARDWDWTYALASGYRDAFERVLACWPSGPVRLLHHTLGAEHANALALAIRQLGTRGARLHHLCLLMYSPGVDADGRTFDPQRRMVSALGFGALRDTGRTALYASCDEYAQAYRHLLDLPAPLPLHAAFIGDWRAPRPPARRGADSAVILYLGEIKQDKGFLDLPGRLRHEIATAPPGRRLILQFAAVRTPAAEHVVAELRAIAAGRPQVEIVDRFLPEPELAALLASAGVLRLDYDARAYAHKTSGLLWLAAWHRLAVAVPPGSWLMREARRLGVPVLPPGAASQAALAVIDHEAEDPAYFAALFTPFRDWLHGLGPPPAGGAESTGPAPRHLVAPPRPPRPPPPRGTGRDIVLFWKQNDSTVYGRRADMIARHLASRDDVRQVLVLDAPIDADRLHALATSTDPQKHDRLIGERTLEKLAGRHDEAKLGHAVFVHPRGDYGPDEQDRPGPAFLDAYEAFLREEFARRDIDPAQAVFWIYPRAFSVAALLPRFAPSRVVVDVVDDHRAWPGVDEAEKGRLTAHYESLLARADLVLANCEPVRDAMRSLGREPWLVPNGCDGPLPRGPADHGGGALDDHLAFDGKILGFVGNLEAKLDLDLLSRLATEFPACRLVLIGSAHANPAVLALRRHANVRLPGVVPYDRLGPWLSRFDVGLVPHRRMELTRYMNPLKTSVYLANGIPVVATGVPNVEPVPGLVTVAADADAFVQAVAACLASGRPPPERFEAAVAPGRWAARLAAPLATIGFGDAGAAG